MSLSLLGDAFLSCPSFSFRLGCYLLMRVFSAPLELVFAIGLLIVAVWIGVVVLVCGIGLFILALGTAFSGIVSPCGGFVVLLNVTLHVSSGGLSFGIGAVSGVLLRMSSSFLSASICSNPFALFFSFNACVKSLSALIIVSAGVMAGCVMYFVLKNTVSDTLSLFICFTKITWHQGMFVSTIHLLILLPMLLISYCFGVIAPHIPLGLMAFCCN